MNTKFRLSLLALMVVGAIGFSACRETFAQTTTAVTRNAQVTMATAVKNPSSPSDNGKRYF